MSEAIDIFVARVTGEEGFRAKAYDDATGLEVKAPKGNLTICYGFNLSAGASKGLGLCILRYQSSEVEHNLLPLAWYGALDPVRQSVVIDLAFNNGFDGFLKYKHTISRLALHDWQGSHDELLDSDAARGDPRRYKPLADIILSGVA